MTKIILPKDIPLFIKELKKNKERIVLAGGCFDILHKGHLVFLRNAKKHGTKLIILLENDTNVKKLKGSNRPIHKQTERARVLSSVRFVDYVIMLSQMKNNQDYAKLVNLIKPDSIAITNDDPYLKNKKEQAENVGAKIIPVTKRVLGQSTTRLINLINNL